MQQQPKILLAGLPETLAKHCHEALQAAFDKETIEVHQTGGTLLEQANCRKPDILILSIANLGTGFIRHLRIITDDHPCMGVIVILESVAMVPMLQALQAGAVAFLSPNSAAQELHLAVNAVCYGGTYFSESLYSQALLLSNKRGFNEATKSANADFSDKELQVLRYICQELETAEIAEAMNVSVPIVEACRCSLYEKTGARNIAGVAMYALRSGIYMPNAMRSI